MPFLYFFSWSNCTFDLLVVNLGWNNLCFFVSLFWGGGVWGGILRTEAAALRSKYPKWLFFVVVCFVSFWLHCQQIMWLIIWEWCPASYDWDHDTVWSKCRNDKEQNNYIHSSSLKSHLCFPSLVTCVCSFCGGCTERVKEKPCNAGKGSWEKWNVVPLKYHGSAQLALPAIETCVCLCVPIMLIKSHSYQCRAEVLCVPVKTNPTHGCSPHLYYVQYWEMFWRRHHFYWQNAFISLVSICTCMHTYW